MAEASKDQDQSMEDILQSIKRIIAEEGEGASAPTGSDVLELTDLLAEDGSVSQVAPGDKPETISIDEIMAAPISSMPEPEPVKPAEIFSVEKVQAPEPEPIPQPEPPKPEPVVQAAPEPALEPVDETLLTNATISTSVAALNALRDSMKPAAPARELPHRAGITVEELAMEGLRPLLKEWLNANLSTIVEAMVQKEIAKLSKN